MANIKARRALSDLFRKGTEVRFGPDPKNPGGDPIGEVGPFYRKDPGTGEPTEERLPPREDQVVMWVTPADPLQREQALREGNAARARSIVKAKMDLDSEEHLTAMAFLSDMSDDTLVEYVVLGDEGVHQSEAEREILSRDEWKDMSSYQDAMRQFQDMDPATLDSNPEWQAMVALDEKYGEQVRERTNELMDAQRELLRYTIKADRSAVEKLALGKRAELAGSSVFVNEFDRWMVFYSVREFEDTSKLFFEDVDDFRRQPQAVKNIISEALLPYISDAGEAKNLLGAADGSEPSVQPNEQATSESSTPQGQTA